MYTVAKVRFSPIPSSYTAASSSPEVLLTFKLLFCCSKPEKTQWRRGGVDNKDPKCKAIKLKCLGLTAKQVRQLYCKLITDQGSPRICPVGKGHKRICTKVSAQLNSCRF